MAVFKHWLLVVTVPAGLVALLVLGGIAACRNGWLEPRGAGVTLAERDFTDGWRQVDLRGAPQMSRCSFAIPADAADAFTEMIVIENASSRQVRNFWFYRADMPNFYSAQTIVDSVTAGARTETDKVLALWALFPRYYYNYDPISTGGMLLDPPTLFSVMGTAQCNYAAQTLSTLCELAGCKTRLLGITYEEGEPPIAHCVMEAYADGRWIYMDPDGHAVYRRADGEWASAEDLKADATPVENTPHAYYPPKTLADAFRKGQVEYLERAEGEPSLADRERIPGLFHMFHHYMRFDLLPGERTEIFPMRNGASYEMPLPIEATGRLMWRYLPENFAGGAPHGLLLENVSLSLKDGSLVLRRIEPLRPASLVVPMTSPFLMTGARVVASVESPEPAQLSILPFARGQLPSLEAWRPAGALTGDCSVVLDEFFSGQPLFGYALGISVPEAGLRIQSLDVVTTLQCAPEALPDLHDGANQFILYAQETPSAPPTAYSDAGVDGVQFTNGLRIGFLPGKPDAIIAERRSGTGLHDTALQQAAAPDESNPSPAALYSFAIR